MTRKQQIHELADGIAREFHPEKIVLFGSHARGGHSPDSDVDLLVVTRRPGKRLDQAAEILTRLRPGFPVDLLVRSPAEIARRLEMDDYFFQEILATGTVLFEARHA